MHACERTHLACQQTGAPPLPAHKSRESMQRGLSTHARYNKHQRLPADWQHSHCNCADICLCACSTALCLVNSHLRLLQDRSHLVQQRETRFSVGSSTPWTAQHHPPMSHSAACAWACSRAGGAAGARRRRAHGRALPAAAVVPGRTQRCRLRTTASSPWRPAAPHPMALLVPPGLVHGLHIHLDLMQCSTVS